MIRAIRRWLVRMFPSLQSGADRPILWPTREEIMALPWFDGIGLEKIVVVESPEQAKRAHDDLSRRTVVGFDTESKPTFLKGEQSSGPHIAQFSTPEKTYIFTLHQQENRKVVSALIAQGSLTKVGFGLSNDVKSVRAKLHVTPQSVIDLETLCAKHGHGRGVGVKVAVAILFKRRFRKSKKIGTSNWMRRCLSDQQLLYAANDAYAALRVYEELNR